MKPKFRIVCNAPSELQRIVDRLSNDYVIVEINVEPVVLESAISRDIVLSGYVSYVEKENDKESVTWEGKGKLVWIPEEMETNE